MKKPEDIIDVFIGQVVIKTNSYLALMTFSFPGNYAIRGIPRNNKSIPDKIFEFIDPKAITVKFISKEAKAWAGESSFDVFPISASDIKSVAAVLRKANIRVNE